MALEQEWWGSALGGVSPVPSLEVSCLQQLAVCRPVFTAGEELLEGTLRATTAPQRPVGRFQGEATPRQSGRLPRMVPCTLAPCCPASQT